MPAFTGQSAHIELRKIDPKPRQVKKDEPRPSRVLSMEERLRRLPSVESVDLSDYAALEIYKRKFSAKQRRELARKGDALPDGSYPIESPEDLKNAERLANSGHGNVAAAKKLIARKKRKFGKSVIRTNGDAPRVGVSPEGPRRRLRKGDGDADDRLSSASRRRLAMQKVKHDFVPEAEGSKWCKKCAHPRSAAQHSIRKAYEAGASTATRMREVKLDGLPDTDLPGHRKTGRDEEKVGRAPRIQTARAIAKFAAECEEGTSLIIKDHTGTYHSVNLRRSWETNASGGRKWAVDVNHNETHEFDSPEEAHSFVKKMGGRVK